MTDQNTEGQDEGVKVVKEPEKSSGSGLTGEERQNVCKILDEAKPKRSETSERQTDNVIMAEDEIELE